MASIDGLLHLRSSLLLPLTSVALLVCVTFSSLTCAQQQTPVITSISGCVDVGSTTMRCVFPTVLTVRGSGFMSGINATDSPYYRAYPCGYLIVSVSMSSLAMQSGWTPPLRRGQGACNDSYFEWQLTYWGYSMYETNVSLPLTVSTGGGATASFSGVNIAPFAPPMMTSVSGCPTTSTNGLSTSSCLPDRDTLTVTGSGFSLWNNTQMYLEIGPQQYWIFWNSELVVLSDSVFTLSMDRAYAWLLAAHDFGGPSLPLGLSDRYTRESVMGSGTLSVQFEALPPPTLTSINIASGTTLAGASCVWTDVNRTALVNCTVGVSGVNFGGSYLFDIAFTVGGLPMTVDYLNPNTATRAFMHMPYSPAFVPNTPYDLVITNGNGLSITYPGFVSFTSETNIAFIDDCRDVGTQDSVGYTNCLVNDTLNMTINNVPAGQPAFTVTIVSASVGNSTCTDPHYVSSTKLACTVPPRSTAASNWDALLVQWVGGAFMWVPSRFYIYDDIDDCRITAVTGCGTVNSANLTLTQCNGGEVLTFTGVRFTAYNYSIAIIDPPPYYYANRVPCNNLLVLNDTTAQCQLPYVEDSAGILNYYTPSLLRLTAMPGYETSNAVIIFWIPGAVVGPAQEASGSSVPRATIALSVVFSVVGVALLVGVVVWLYSRRRAAPKEINVDSEEFSSQGATHRHLVELA
jgi:hypothetical protein